jgi:hypothetical protein
MDATMIYISIYHDFTREPFLIYNSASDIGNIVNVESLSYSEYE